jgi:putative ABC transport system ATP-binding protein
MTSITRINSDPAALVMAGVTRVFDGPGGPVVALDSVDLTVAAGEIVALVGRSGSGKTTLCSIAGGLLRSTRGSVTVGGTDISALTGRASTEFRRDHVGFVFQSINLLPFLTARENLLVLDETVAFRRRRRDRRHRADVLLSELGLAERADNLPSQLSGGERQRVAIGRALMNRPSLVLLDEPTSALDSTLSAQVMQLIHDELKRRSTAAIIVTHDGAVADYADRTVGIGDGRLAADQ